MLLTYVPYHATQVYLACVWAQCGPCIQHLAFPNTCADAVLRRDSALTGRHVALTFAALHAALRKIRVLPNLVAARSRDVRMCDRRRCYVYQAPKRLDSEQSKKSSRIANNI